MKSYHLISQFVLWCLFATILLSCTQQQDSSDDNSQADHRKSPIAIAATKHQDTYVKVVYGQPYKRGRDIFGGLVPYGEVWRTGANEATEITFTQPVSFAGKTVESGTYSLFTIPNEEQWTIILNDELGQWGAFEYDKERDVLRVDVSAKGQKKAQEAFTISFPEEVNGDKTTMTMVWDRTKVEIPIGFNPDA